VKIAIAALCLCALSASAETKPDITLHPADLVNLAAIPAYRTLDYLSTRRGLDMGYHEAELPQFVVKSSPRLAVFEGLATVVQMGGYVWLVRHDYRKFARIENAISITLGTATVVRNYSIEAGR
jgi:hypothetical protein